jgi:hypothetical protein
MVVITVMDIIIIEGIATEVATTTITDTDTITEDAIEHNLGVMDIIEMPMTIDAMATEAVQIDIIEAIIVDITAEIVTTETIIIAEVIQIDITEVVIITEIILLPHAVPEFQTDQGQVITAAIRKG